ncbi:MAG: phosphoribosylanthranilate isomerase, partial [Gemmobacter sp.]
DVDAAVRAGARYVGFVFFPASPRAVTPDAARALALRVPGGAARVALTVDADDALLDAILAAVPVDILQLHGHESPERVAAVRARYGLPVMKAVGVAGAGDIEALAIHARAADMLLVDAKPPKGAALPGGNGAAFDWRLIAGRRWPVPWLLAGGLTADTVAEALRVTGAPGVDVSSGVESAPGVKDAARMAAFVAAAQGGPAPPERSFGRDDRQVTQRTGQA